MSIPSISTTDLATVSGGAPSNVNNLAAWGLGPSSGPAGGGGNPSGITPQDIMNAKPADNRVLSQPNSSPFPPRPSVMTSPQDNSWMNRIPDMYRQLGM
jgi:hypothetical protein